MKIPKTIKIGAHKIPVVLFKEKREGGEPGTINLGRFSSKNGGHQLDLWDALYGTQRGEIFLHEILEGTTEIYGLVLDHQTISTLSAALYQVLHENKLRF